MKTFKKKTANRGIKVSKRTSANLAIGKIEKGSDTFILTYGQFSLIDALIAIMDQTGPAHVAISTWTAAHAHLDRSAEMMEKGKFLSFRMIVDMSFKARASGYYDRMTELFGLDCVRMIRTHAKFIVITNDEWKIVVRTSMNLNENPRLENLEISEGKEFAEFFTKIVDEIFYEVDSAEITHRKLNLNGIEETEQFKLVSGGKIENNSVKEPAYHHVLAN